MEKHTRQTESLSQQGLHELPPLTFSMSDYMAIL
jgi:hypothetical protein